LRVKWSQRADHGETSYKGSEKLVGRKALITGGDSGIGRAAGIAYAREGADVAISYLQSEEADAREVIELIGAEGRKAVALPGDITDEAWCKKLVDEAHASLGGLDILVINAGRQQYRVNVSEVSSEDFDKTLKTNLYAMHWITQAAVKHLPAGASVIMTASVQAYDPSAILLDYATTKAGIVAYTKALAAQLIEKGIRANVVAPGPFWTVLQSSGGQPQEKVAKFGEQSKFGRPGQPVEIAPIYVLLASQEGSYITGEVYGVTGGAGIA
jgi:NAD(P)-dependent dehydrogenase (short-subunit alcohol dehydrogenase family)